jgi:hypothetical protein
MGTIEAENQFIKKLELFKSSDVEEPKISTYFFQKWNFNSFVNTALDR